MPVGFLYDGMWSLKDLCILAKEVENYGLDSVWLAEHLLHREAIVASSILLKATRELKIIPGPISPYIIHPAYISMIINTYHEFAKERIEILLGTGDRATMRDLGIEITKPLSKMKEAIETIRLLSRGETVSSNGCWNLRNIKLKYPSSIDIPIYLTGIGPKMISLANEVADGIVLSAAISPKFATYSLGFIDNKFSRKQNFKKIGFILSSVHNDYKKAIEQVKPELAFMLRGSYLEEDWKMNQLEINGDAIRDELDVEKNTNAAVNLIQDMVVETITATGTPRIFQERLNEYVKSGIDYPIILPVGDIKRKIHTIKLAIEVLK